jgi:hypothetical protein
MVNVETTTSSMRWCAKGLILLLLLLDEKDDQDQANNDALSTHRCGAGIVWIQLSILLDEK